MKHFKICMIALFFCMLQIHQVQSQVIKGVLMNAAEISSEIAPGENHQYKLRLEKDQTVFLRLMQQEINLKITTYDPDGERMEEFNSRNRNNGSEFIRLSSKSKGDYSINITAVGEKASPGNYRLNVEKIKPKAVTQEELVDEVFAPWDSGQTPGAAVAVVKDGAIVYKKGYGMANLEYDIPIVPSTVFHIASISKQFTVFAVLLLEKQGELSLDDDIRKYIPEVPDFGKTITLRHLANHTSGLRDQWNLLAMAGWRLDDVITKEHVLKLVKNQKELNFDPGEEYLYCNTGFTLLAEVVSRVSGQSFAEFTDSNIFVPLGMSKTLFYDDHEKIVKNRAYSYSPDKDGYKKSVLSYANVGATSLFTTVEDLSLWALNFEDPVVGDIDMLNKMNTPAVLNNGETFGGGLGQFIGQYKGLNEIQHGGADAGYRTYLTRFPDQNLAVAVFSNDGSFSSATIAHKVVDIYLKDEFKIPEPVEKPNTEEAVSVDLRTLESYVGEYKLEPGVTIKITEDNGILFGQASGQPVLLLKALSVNEFTVDGAGARIEFLKGTNGKTDSIKVNMGDRTMEGSRIETLEKDAVDLSDFEGNFYSDELTTGYEFIVVGDQLLARHSRSSDIELEPEKEDLFSGNKWFFGKVEFIRNAENKITGCKVSSGRVKNVWFRKTN